MSYDSSRDSLYLDESVHTCARVHTHTHAKSNFLSFFPSQKKMNVTKNVKFQKEVDVDKGPYKPDDGYRRHSKCN